MNKKTIFSIAMVIIMLGSSFVVLGALNHPPVPTASVKNSTSYRPLSTSIASQLSSVTQPTFFQSLLGQIESSVGLSSFSDNSLLDSVIPSSVIQSNATITPAGISINTLDLNNYLSIEGVSETPNAVAQGEVVYDPANNNLYLLATFYDANTFLQDSIGDISAVLVLNGTTMQMENSIAMPSFPSMEVLDPVNHYLYVASSTQDTIYAISTSNNSFIGNMSLGSSAGTISFMSVSNNGTVFVSLSSLFEVLEIFPNFQLSVISTRDFGEPASLAYDPQNNYLYVSVPGYNNSQDVSGVGAVLAINLSNTSQMVPVQRGYSVISLAYSNGNVYGAEFVGTNIAVIHGLKEIGNITTRTGADLVFANPTTGDLYISYEGNQAFFNSFVNFENSAHTSGQKVTFNSSVSNILSGQFSVYSVSAGKYVLNRSSLTPPVSVSFNPQSGEAYLSYVLPGEISTLSSGLVQTNVSLGSYPSDVYYDSGNGYLYVTDSFDGKILIIDASTESLVKVLNVGGMPLRIASNSDGSDVFVSNVLNNQIEEISGLNIIRNYSNGFANLTFTYDAGIGLSFMLPFDLTYDSMSNTLYVSEVSEITNVMSSESPLEGFVQAINLTSGASTYIKTSNFALPTGIVYDPATNLVYVSNFGNKTSPITVISGTSVDSSISKSLSNSLISDSCGNIVDMAYDPETASVYITLSTSIFEKPISEGISADAIAEIYSNNSLSPVMGFQSGLKVLGVTTLSYDQYNGKMLLSAAIYAYRDSLSTFGYSASGAVFFLTGLNITSIIQTSLGTAAVSATSSSYLYAANSISGTLNLLSTKTSGLVRFHVKVTPTFATVSVNDIPVSLINGYYNQTYVPGTYFISVSSAGYSTYSNLYNLSANRTLYLNVSLTPITNFGYLSGSVVPEDAVISVNGINIEVDDGNFNVTLPGGTYAVSVDSPDYQGFSTLVTVSPGKVTTETFILAYVQKTYEISGYLSPYNGSDSPSIVFNGTVATLNSSGYFQVYLSQGEYHLSATENGYFSISRTLNLSGNTIISVYLTKEPSNVSKLNNSVLSSQGVNATIKNVYSNFTLGYVGLNFTANQNSTVIITVPFSSLASSFTNLTINQLFQSKVYIGNTLYRNFTIAVSSSYMVTLTVYNYTGDPALYWVYTPYSHFSPTAPKPAPVPPSSLFKDYIFYIIIGVVVVLIAVVTAILSSRRRR
jgi:YVTN family beta-propeller protein